MANDPEEVRIEFLVGKIRSAALPIPLGGPIAIDVLADNLLVVSRASDRQIDLEVEAAVGAAELFRLRVQTGAGCRLQLDLDSGAHAFDVPENEDQVLVIT
jgi:hypothetical protein